MGFCLLLLMTHDELKEVPSQLPVHRRIPHSSRDVELRSGSHTTISYIRKCVLGSKKRCTISHLVVR